MTTDDARITPDLIFDVFDVLERHGYHRYDNRHTGLAIGAILDLAYVYDGTRDISYVTYATAGPARGPRTSRRRRRRRGHPHRRRSPHPRRRAGHRR